MFLFDTNVWLWWTNGSTERLSVELRREIDAPGTQVFVRRRRFVGAGDQVRV
jgi:PIN domain nuclease of toxin-antitoxin system